MGRSTSRGPNPSVRPRAGGRVERNDKGEPVWRTPEGELVSCYEKLKVLNENLEEIRDMSQEALEDAILMGCDEAQIRRVLHELMDSLTNPYRKK